ncbi:unnamed protein product [Nyctereutes procyonoides]|uniref:(raccoon dog) hypothetical protein n=1 Tax=Nyctereutes procyonoides TaxID=34880 RepID=A0A811ZEF5_NYCPR|nr:unnamed protein product [Nyctereutes procyonoides]
MGLFSSLLRSFRIFLFGSLGGAVVWRLPLAQGVVIPGSCIGLPVGSLLLSLPMCLSHVTIQKKNWSQLHFSPFLHREREREAETQAEGEAGSMHWEPDVGFDPGSPGSRPGPKAGAKPLRHPGIPQLHF